VGVRRSGLVEFLFYDRRWILRRFHSAAAQNIKTKAATPVRRDGLVVFAVNNRG
jgi:hypothetical protein